MTSKTIEDIHVSLLNKLLSDSGLECIRTAPVSLESFSVTGEMEEQGPSEAAEEAAPEEQAVEEEKEQIVEETPEELPEIFPSPSLRRVLPDRIRKIEEQNRIHVLPQEFKTEIDPQTIPKINETPPQRYIDILAEIVGCKNYKSSLAEYWFLDTLANLLRRAQEDDLHGPTQAVLILWFCEWMKEMQHFDAADRQRMLRRFQDNMLSAARFIAEEKRLPTPTDAGVYYKSPEDLQEGYVSKTAVPAESQKHLVTFEGAPYECSLRDLTNITHYIFDLFSTDYQYNLVRSIFTFPPEYVLIDAPFPILNPKRLYAPVKIKPKKEKSPKKEVKVQKGKKKEVDTEEYLALLELIARDEREQEEQDLQDLEDWNRRSHILPLAFSTTDEFFDKYWPPPPPPPEPEPEPEPKKGKGKGKK